MKNRKCHSRSSIESQAGPIFGVGGFAVSEARPGISRIELVVKPPYRFHMNCRFIALDRQRLALDPCPSESCQPKVPIVFEPFHSCRCNSSRLRRVAKRLGCVPLCYGAIEVDLTRIDSNVHYYALTLTDVRAGRMAEDDRALLHSHDDRYQDIYVERRKGQWKSDSGRSHRYGFLATREQLSTRMAQIVTFGQNAGLFGDPLSDVDLDAIYRILFRLYGGYDTELFCSR
ncbi:MAG: hypothetical protein R3E01_30895 [Pirellulaceae bacterium]